ncbi:phage head closure protein [Virgibacillus salexigens]|uniref:Phage head-tail adapter protein n=1 Tax=Virgibacillus kapii TaxID=1638645 RepID=A0ABQ2DKW5_9BACI|nr:phage head closure protein [Virgibacillus kapii]GGJ61993.1 hypothetical protein GCM10007111_25120 [Virgibacillus kapii]
MRKDKELILIKQEYKFDDLKNQIPDGEPRRKPVLCSVNSVSRNEFYNAGNKGFKPEKVFSMYSFEYDNEALVEFEGQTYSVIRSYVTSYKDIELTCERNIGQ